MLVAPVVLVLLLLMMMMSRAIITLRMLAFLYILKDRRIDSSDLLPG